LLLDVILEHLFHRGYKLSRIIKVIHVKRVVIVENNIWRLVWLQLPVFLTLINRWYQSWYAIIRLIAFTSDLSLMKVLEALLTRLFAFVVPLLPLGPRYDDVLREVIIDHPLFEQPHPLFLLLDHYVDAAGLPDSVLQLLLPVHQVLHRRPLPDRLLYLPQFLLRRRVQLEVRPRFLTPHWGIAASTTLSLTSL